MTREQKTAPPGLLLFCTRTSSFFSSNPEKESISIWLSVLFVIISLAKLVWDTKKLRQGGEK